MKVAVVAGEASGDAQAANLLRELSAQLPAGVLFEVWGIGGPNLTAIGCEIIADSSKWGSISIAESVTKGATVLSALSKFKRRFSERTPDLLILVDFGAFNIPLARWVKWTAIPALHPKRECPIVYYFPPSSWRRKMNPKKLQRLTAVSDLIITPFSWSADLLKSAGGNAYFLGHPLLDTVKPKMDSGEFDKIYGLDKIKTVVTLLPGSREHEVRHILPVLFAAAGEIARRMPGVQFLLARSPNLSRSLIEDILVKAQQQGSSASLLHLAQQASDLIKHASTALKSPMTERVSSLATPEGLLVSPNDPDKNSRDWAQMRMTSTFQTAPVAIVDNATLDAMARADLVIAASGTATLEAAILGRPTVIVYRGSALMNFEYLLRKKALNLTYIGLPNILAEQLICPEFLQDDATPQNIADQALEMLLQPEKLLQIKSKLLSVVHENLGEAGAIERSAAKVLEYMKSIQTTSENLVPRTNS